MPRVGIVGVGLIGRAWANVFARAGWSVALWDANPQALAAAPALIRRSLDDLVPHGLVNDAAAAAENLRVGRSLQDTLNGADLVQESGPEQIDIKIAMYRELDSLADPATILASSTSALVASRFTSELPGRVRCLVAHPVNPPHVVPIVELCGAPWTSPDVMVRARQFYESVGQSAVEVRKEIDGFILNRMQSVLLAEAFRLIGEGYVSAADLDKTIKDGLGRRWAFMGPMETIELNAPNGIADYCARYSKMLHGLSESAVTADIWGPENCQRVADSWGERPTADHVLSKSAWRDERLGALAAHLNTAKAYGDE
ncbi:3-hydroxyacyl-CoA dehydrogenase [Granulosicoccus antarcticus]|uniref:L-carnitine dehydrogenase n=1 Tax=Granulosicoccus antarcticus IMCC3135 TaxID=1192854 RepID=A0A2Z2NTZ7_9GAMM|nr:3-hydroxyacyl-CoA dehydrogenase [Granulosicoccus antarcticus]ASJ73511.1 L-carnitine dehydrogenase [Granulosicoccus antarcticus IMCC3135]